MDLSFLDNKDPAILQQVIQRLLYGVNTSIPGTVQSFDSTNQTVIVTPNIRQIVTALNGTSIKQQLPDLIQVPCVFPYSTSTGFSLTFPVGKGDQCLIIFSQRSIDNWHKYGRVQDPVELTMPRAHSLCDGIAIVGLIALPNAIPSWQNDGVVMRNTNLGRYVKVSNAGIDVVCCAPDWSDEVNYPVSTNVKYGSAYYVCTKQNGPNNVVGVRHPDNTDTDPEYVDTSNYTVDQIVQHSGSKYICIAANGPGTLAGVQGTANPLFWSLVSFWSSVTGFGDSTISLTQNTIAISAPTINIKGNVFVSGTMSGVTANDPILTGNGISHSGKTINAVHVHSGVRAGPDNSGGVV